MLRKHTQRDKTMRDASPLVVRKALQLIYVPSSFLGPPYHLRVSVGLKRWRTRKLHTQLMQSLRERYWLGSNQNISNQIKTNQEATFFIFYLFWTFQEGSICSVKDGSSKKNEFKVYFPNLQIERESRHFLTKLVLWELLNNYLKFTLTVSICFVFSSVYVCVLWLPWPPTPSGRRPIKK